MASSFRNPVNGYVENVRFARIWCLLFGPLYFAAKGVWSHALISLVAAFLTFGISWLIYPFFAQRIVEASYLRKGWQSVNAPSSSTSDGGSAGYRAGYRFAQLSKTSMFASVAVLLAIAIIVGHSLRSEAPQASTNTREAGKPAETPVSSQANANTPAPMGVTPKTKPINKAALAGLKRVRDDVEAIDFYWAANDRNLGSYWTLYIGVPAQGEPYLVFRFQYAANTWLFIRHVTLNVDGEKLTSLPLNLSRIRRSAGSGGIWEIEDQTIVDSDIPFFARLAHSGKTIIRYEGDQFHRDEVLSAGDKTAMLKVLSAYALLKQ